MATCPDYAREIHGISVGGTSDVFAGLGVSAFREHLQLAAVIRRVVGLEPADPELVRSSADGAWLHDRAAARCRFETTPRTDPGMRGRPEELCENQVQDSWHG